ncbi:hypothetical protein ACFC34_00405 [Streptomyces sp. NPDC056053]|uniref:hypothetical protein n=1 Tax=Streptomyces sp. NPDC056053 TaxID=3345696 RepID=UPI0035DE1DFB
MKYHCTGCNATMTAPTDTDTIRCPGCGEMADKATEPADEMRAADTLRNAATWLRHAAKSAHGASPAPWSHDYQCAYSWNGLIVADRSCASDDGHPEQERDLPYIATMHPGVGLALADWLDETARYASLYISLTIATTGALPAAEEYDSLTRRALAVARQIIGTTTSEGEPGCAHCGRTDHVWETCEAYTAAVAEETDEEREQREDREAIARNHAAGDHQHCGVTCEVKMPTDHLRNFVIAKGYPGTAGALDELLRRAAVLHEAADRLSMDWGGPDHADGMDEARQQLRRMADEAQQPISAVTEERQQPTPRPCTDPCIACMTDESHDPAVTEEPGR